MQFSQNQLGHQCQLYMHAAKKSHAEFQADLEHLEFSNTMQD